MRSEIIATEINGKTSSITAVISGTEVGAAMAAILGTFMATGDRSRLHHKTNLGFWLSDNCKVEAKAIDGGVELCLSVPNSNPNDAARSEFERVVEDITKAANDYYYIAYLIHLTNEAQTELESRVKEGDEGTREDHKLIRDLSRRIDRCEAIAGDMGDRIDSLEANAGQLADQIAEDPTPEPVPTAPQDDPVWIGQIAAPYGYLDIMAPAQWSADQVKKTVKWLSIAFVCKVRSAKHPWWRFWDKEAVRR